MAENNFKINAGSKEEFGELEKKLKNFSDNYIIKGIGTFVVENNAAASSVFGNVVDIYPEDKYSTIQQISPMKPAAPEGKLLFLNSRLVLMAIDENRYKIEYHPRV